MGMPPMKRPSFLPQGAVRRPKRAVVAAPASPEQRASRLGPGGPGRHNATAIRRGRAVSREQAMSLSMYEASVPCLVRMLRNLSAILRHNGIALGKGDFL